MKTRIKYWNNYVLYPYWLEYAGKHSKINKLERLMMTVMLKIKKW